VRGCLAWPRKTQAKPAAAVATEEAARKSLRKKLDLAENESDVNDDGEVAEEESGARFIPTEEISQDFGVSFPVDI
jgi:hypothetical protein